MTIVEFLNARLDEEEAAAKAARKGPWAMRNLGRHDQSAVVQDSGRRTANGLPIGPLLAHVESDHGAADARHIARHDPPRVLADVAARRAIFGAHAHEHECIELTGSGDHSVVDGEPWELWEPRHTADHGPCFVLRSLAAVYADYPDYRPEWAP